MSKKITTEEFIKRAKSIHGDKWDYSKVEYVNYSTKVKIICKIHGEYEKYPGMHLSGQGCKQCIYKNQTLDTETFVKKARMVHGSKYDYSPTQYCNAKTKVIIKCLKHGNFIQIPDSHLRKSGCPKCCGKNKTTKAFILEAENIHGNKYDYSQVKYKNSSTKIRILCKIHGIFIQVPNSHLSGNGCSKCGTEKRSKFNSINLQEFIKKAKEAHGNMYDYSKVEYKNYTTKVKIICKVHGTYKQLPPNHIKGSGCQKCAKIKRVKTRLLGKKTFIKRANSVHKNKYDYSKVEYKNFESKIVIKCPKHGEFLQKVGNHLNGKGCAQCVTNISNPQIEIYNFIKEKHPKYSILLDKVVKPTRYRADILIEETKTIIEYNGDYWHCNPNIYTLDYYHKLKKKTAKEIWEYDNKRKKDLEILGYKVFIIWESDYKYMKNNITNLINLN